MPARPRKEIVDESVPGFYHCFSRCVRQAFLCGQDEYAQKNYDHRKGWVESRLAFLASKMTIEVTGTAIMDNHFHVILKTRPDVIQNWSDREVARRWLWVCPGERQPDPEAPPVKPTEQKIAALLKEEKEQIPECRKRLASLSWMVKLLKEPIARFANAEDSCSGAFFEGRFKSTRLLDIYALVLCSMYVDLNSNRAGKAKTPETSLNTSAYLRIQSRQARSTSSRDSDIPADALAAAWISPIDEDALPPDGAQAEHGRRLNDRGFLPMSFDKYLMLMDWSGRQLRHGKRGTIPDNLAPILDRLDLAAEHWIEGLQSFQTWFSDFAGRPATLRAHAAENGRRWIRGAR